MDVFSCRVRPGGNIFHEVNKHDISAAEVILLRTIHDGNGEVVVGLVRTGKSELSNREEYVRLAEIYTPDAVKNVFGPITQARLPTTLDDEFEDAVPTAAHKPKAKKAAKHAPVPADDDDDLDNM